MLLRMTAHLVSLAFGVLALGYAFQQPWATRTWMWPDGRLSYLFIGSMIAAMAIGIFWVGRTAEWAAGFAGALNWAAGFGAMSATLFRIGTAPIHAGIFAFASAWSLAVALYWRRFPVRDTRPLPRLVRGSFLVFLLVLFGVSYGLLTANPTIFPWPLKPESSRMFGSLFLGSAVYFTYGFLRPVWGIGHSQLLAFLAYDLVLIVPYLRHFAHVKPEHRTSLIVYTVVIVYSGLLSIHYLFLNRETRVLSRAT